MQRLNDTGEALIPNWCIKCPSLGYWIKNRGMITDGE